MDCAARVLDAVNTVFDATFPPTCIVATECGMHGGAYNIVIVSVNTPILTFNRVKPGRYPLDGWKCWLYGGGRHLHIPSGGESTPCCGPIAFKKAEGNGCSLLRFTAHVDDGFPYHPFGFVYHMIRDVAFSESRRPCP